MVDACAFLVTRATTVLGHCTAPATAMLVDSACPQACVCVNMDTLELTVASDSATKRVCMDTAWMGSAGAPRGGMVTCATCRCPALPTAPAMASAEWAFVSASLAGKAKPAQCP